MAFSTPQKWLLGCGIGCAAIIVIVVGLVTGTMMYVRGRIQPLQEASNSRREIVTAYGTPESFVPPADGAIPRERLEIFLSARAALKDSQNQLDTAIANFDFDRLRQRQTSFPGMLRALNDMGNVIVPIGTYANNRNTVLIGKKMGLGEYAYIYTIAYHSWLGHKPSEGPAFLERAGLRDGNRSSENDAGFTPEGVRRQYQRLALRFLENQLAATPPSDSRGRDMLKKEIDSLNQDADRIAWQDNLPPAIEESLRPFRARLAETYRASSNYFELLTMEDINRFRMNGSSGWEFRNGRWTGQAEAPEAAAAESAGIGITYEVGPGVTAPMPLQNPAPAYTEDARRAQAEGVVTLQGTIRKDGTVARLRMLRGPGHGLEEAAMKIVSEQWKFKPGSLNGQPVEVQAKITIPFRMH
jgi:TonB family protein